MDSFEGHEGASEKAWSNALVVERVHHRQTSPPSRYAPKRVPRTISSTLGNNNGWSKNVSTIITEKGAVGGTSKKAWSNALGVERVHHRQTSPPSTSVPRTGPIAIPPSMLGNNNGRSKNVSGIITKKGVVGGTSKKAWSNALGVERVHHRQTSPPSTSVPRTGPIAIPPSMLENNNGRSKNVSLIITEKGGVGGTSKKAWSNALGVERVHHRQTSPPSTSVPRTGPIAIPSSFEGKNQRSIDVGAGAVASKKAWSNALVVERVHHRQTSPPSEEAIATVASVSSGGRKSTASLKGKLQKKNRPYKRRRTKYRDIVAGDKLRKIGIDGMLATAHVMVAKKPTSEKVRSIVGEAMMELSSRKGNLKKALRKDRGIRKKLPSTKVQYALHCWKFPSRAYQFVSIVVSLYRCSFFPFIVSRCLQSNLKVLIRVVMP